MSRARRTAFHEPSLVPLADMLSNTVGIIVFILIFTVLTAGSVVVAKRLPMEHATRAESVCVVCRQQRVFPLAIDALITRLEASCRADPPSCPQDLAGREVSDDYCTATITVSFAQEVAVCCAFKDGVGETARELKAQTGHLAQVLRNRDRGRHFIYFFVYPDSIESFLAARALAQARGYQTGWAPCGQEQKLTFGASGREAVPQ